jgi:SSS family solute:Na+ symporter
MNMSWIDWLILAAVYLAVMITVGASRKYMRSVADFLAAGRTSGRYLLSVSQGIAAIGAITIVANFEMNYEAGFAMSWWGMSMGLFTTLAAVSGWVIYRFRATRCLTLAEFFERRYSCNFRVFAGVIAFLAGIINMGIFPAVSARFFIYFLGIPLHFNLWGLEIPTYPLVMIFLLSSALFTVFAGGHVAVVITDFLQGVFTNIFFVIFSVYLLSVVKWPRVMEILLNRHPGKSLVNPFDTSYVEDFNFWFFLIGVVGFLYSALSWQGTQGYNVSAKSAHEAKMGSVLSNWRGMPQGLFMSFIPILMLTVYTHPDWAQVTQSVNQVVGNIDNTAVQNQMRVPILLSMLLPKGLMGAMAAVMFAAYITTDNTYLHSWGSIFIQDVILPWRKKPLSKDQHLKVLKASILGVAIFIFFFSLFFKQTDAILMFFAITGAIFAGGSGAVIIGGLYTRWGNTPAAWVTMIAGSSIAVGGIILQHIYKDFPVNGQEFWAIAIGTSVVLYTAVSFLVKPRKFDLEKLLHRGKYTIESEFKVITQKPSLGWRMFGMGKEFTKGDKALFIVTYIWMFGWVGLFIVGTIYCLFIHPVSTESWVKFWQVYIGIQMVMSCVVIVWFSIGGFRDLRWMLRSLSTMARDDSDIGQVEKK